MDGKIIKLNVRKNLHRILFEKAIKGNYSVKKVSVLELMPEIGYQVEINKYCGSGLVVFLNLVEKMHFL